MDKNQKDRRGRVNYIWVLAGGYLIYLGYQVFRMFWKGTAGMPALTVPAAAVFIVVGALLLRREWISYKYGKAHIDDPDTWADKDETPAPPEEPLPPASGDEEDSPPLSDAEDGQTDDEKSGGETK